MLRPGEYIEAFEQPQEYIAAHPEQPLAYCVAAFYLRERLRDVLNKLPARHVFRNEENNEVALVVEPTTGDSHVQH